MKTFENAAARRAGLAVALLLGGAVVSPAFAACNPTARAQSEAQTLPELTAGSPTTVHLDGTASTPKNGLLSFSWQYLGSTPAGYAVTLVNANTAQPTFAAPDVGPAGANLSFRLTVTCQGATSTATTGINITDVVVNYPPTAVGSVSPASIHEGDLVTLDGTASYDLNNTPQTSGLAYQWKQVDATGNPVVGGVVLNPNPNGSIATFIAPNMADSTSGSTLRFRLTVSDGSLSNSTDKLVTVLWLNDPPVARLACPGGVIEANEGDLVTLDGSASTDTDDGIASYTWSQQNGPPNIPVGSLTTASISFIAPALGYQQIGSLPFTLTVTDNHGDASSAGCSVFIHDVTKPVITVPSDITAEAQNAQGAVQAYVVTGFDAVDDLTPYPLACTPPSGSVFALGTTTVQCATSDSAGNLADATFKIKVVDTTAPILQPHAEVAVEATSAAGAIVAFDAPVASDAVDADPTVTCTPPSGSQFPLGGSDVTCGASDFSGNAAAPVHFAVNVLDTTAPVVTPPADVVVEATGAQTTVDYGTATATDAVGVVSISSDAPATFPVATTTIHWMAKDAASNTGFASSQVTVQDTTPPTIDGHAAIDHVEATSPAGAAVTYDSPATHDLVDGDGTATCTPASGSTFALGTHAVTCNASDAHHNAATATSFDVTVVDTTPPTIDAHAAIDHVEATSAAGAAVTYDSPATHDLVDGDGTAVCTPASGSTFALGTHAVTCNATDAHHNAATATSFDVTVVDTTPPTIDAHADVGPIEATSGAGAIVAYTSPATSDLVDGPGVASCSPLSGAQFALGDTTVACAAVDHAHNAATTTTFKVLVRDTTAPVIAARADITAEATGPSGASVNYASPATSDAVDGTGIASCLPVSGSTFALGAHTVACNAHDAAGNISTATSFTITVRDTTAPAIAPHADVNVTATGSSSALVSYTLPTAVDLVDGNVAVTCTPASATTFTVGATTVNCSARDHAGNTAASSFRVVVSYDFSGFFRPVDNLPVVNVVKAGSAIPVKFSLGGNQGLDIFASGSPASISTACNAAATDAIEETVTAGGSSLSYDAGSGQYIYVWKTDRSWTGCRQLQVRLRDGSSRWASFSFTR